ncbi:MAG: hypothetical protein IKS03_03470 [Ruminococcus sp.]|nr:hypothetical protein [Ruminococcus sp.]
MIKDLKEGKYFPFEGKFYSSFFGREMKIFIEGASVEYAEKCIENFNNMSEELKDKIFRAAKAYCLDFMDMVGEEEILEELTVPIYPDTDPKEIYRCIQPSVFIVEEPEDENKIGWQIECNCDWEIEHGMEIDVLDGKLVYLSSFNGYSPWMDFEDDEYNYVNKI